MPGHRDVAKIAPGEKTLNFLSQEIKDKIGFKMQIYGDFINCSLFPKCKHAKND
jgi:hypothetical protein